MMGIGVPFAVSMSTPHRQCVLQRRVTCLETVIQHDWIPAPIDDSVLHRLVVSHRSTPSCLHQGGDDHDHWVVRSWVAFVDSGYARIPLRTAG